MKAINTLILHLILLVLTAYLSSCSSGQKAFEQGNYYDAVLKAVSRLRANTDQEKAQEALQNAYPLAIKSLEEAIQNTQMGNELFKWDKVVSYYNQINYLYQQIQSSPGALKVIPNPFNPVNELLNARQNAAMEYFKAAENAIASGNREGARQAYRYFLKTKEFNAQFRDIDQKIRDAKDQGTLRVMIEPIPNPNNSREISAGFLQQKLLNYIHTNSIHEFVKFYSPVEANNTPYPMDHVLRMQFADLKLSEANHYERVEDISKDSVQVGTVKVGEEEKPIFETVKAKLKTLRKEIQTSGILQVEVLDPIRQELIYHQDFQNQSIWSSEWGICEGDKRALTNAQLQLIQKKEEPSPRPQKLFEDFSQVVFQQLTPWLSNYYRNL
ncbi:MAG: hypothetical protein NW226_06960 [Microscillaceae bacterium]|nr:hypothetical protein [Microscillaceae bacterium]